MFKELKLNKTVLSLSAVAVLIMLASVSIASEGTHHPDSAVQLKDFGWRVFNFAALAAVLFWALKKADLKGSLKERQLQIEKSLKDAQAAKEAAEAKLIEYTGKLEKASQEIDEIHATIIREGERERDRIIAEAKAAADKIMLQAEQAAEQEVVKARAALKAEATRLAVELAAGKLAGSVGKADHDLFVGEYLEKVEQL